MAPKRGPKSMLPAPLPEGHIVKDLERKEWKLGKKIGEGGFGLIYLASAHAARPVDDASAVHVIKVEYHENGPLFTELKFYQRAAKPENIKKWIRQKGLPYLGIPGYWGTGSSEHNGKSYRFMVMDRLGSDLQKLILQRKPSVEYILQIGIRVLEVLEFMHENEYVHGDIKAANLMLGFRNPDEVYLADYGLCYRYCPDGTHKPYKENPKKGHNGTIEFTSLDAHRGAAPSRRGDLEVLGYCLLRWLCGELPWEQNLKDPGAVQAAKTKLLDELPNSVLTLASGKSTTREVAEYLTCVYKLSYDEKPNYDVLKRILSGGLDSPCANVKGLQNISAAAGYSPVDFQVGCQKANPEPVKLRVQNKTCEKKVKAASAGMKYHKTQEYDPAFTNEVRCRSETSGTKVVLQKPPSKPVLKCFQKKTCEEVAKVTENGYCIKCQVADENEELFVRETYYNKEIPRAKVCTKSEASYQCLRTTFTEAEDMASKEDRDGNRSAYMFEHQQPNAKDGLFEGSANPRILQPRFSATAKAQMMAIVLVLLITFLLLYSDNVQVLLRRQLL